ncbi:MAG: acyl-CoA dehydrogenase family protein, partial [Methylobacteriaceae bacterium]|nr:acyl-CoA dehydrogenase family protein [Methylobacteriaceae bacterium]
MDFSLAEEQRLLVDTFAAFARAELAPGYGARDRAAAFPAALWRRLGALGAFG